MSQRIRRVDVWWIALDPTRGAEIRKTRPGVVLTHNTLNNIRRTVIVVPLSTAASPHPPITVPVTCQGRPAIAVTDQIRAVAKGRLESRIGRLSAEELDRICRAVSTILALQAIAGNSYTRLRRIFVQVQGTRQAHSELSNCRATRKLDDKDKQDGIRIDRNRLRLSASWTIS